MDQQQASTRQEGRLTRREALRGAGAIGFAAALAGHAPRLAFASQATPAAGAFPEVLITARDYQFELPATIEGGWTLVTLDNQGQEGHHAMFLQPAGDATVEDIEAAMGEPDLGALLAVATTVGGPPSLDPGRRGSVVMNLAPGEYIVACAIPGPDGMPHYSMGMYARIEVTALASNALPAVADAKITMLDFSFDSLPSEVPAGPATWEVFNDGEQVHEMVVAQLAPGVTFDQLMQMMGPPPEASPATAIEATPAASPAASPAAAAGPPFVVIGGVAPMSPGQTNWAVMDFEAGNYFAICFVPDPASGAPHFALGMVAPFTVS